MASIDKAYFEEIKAEHSRYKAALHKLNICNCHRGNGIKLDGHDDWCSRLIANGALYPNATPVKCDHFWERVEVVHGPALACKRCGTYQGA